MRHASTLRSAWEATVRVLIGVGACTAGIGLAALFAQTTLYERLNNWLYDSLQRSLGQTTNLDSVVVFDVDEESLWRMSQSLGPFFKARGACGRARPYPCQHRG